MRLRYIKIILLFSVAITYGQTDEKIKAIRKIVENINTDKTISQKKLTNEQWMEQGTDGGGELKGYFKNGQLVKIVENVGLSSCTSLYEYYLNDNSVIFIFGQEYVFKYDDKTGSFDYKVQTISMESRFYFENGKLIKSKFDGKPRCADQPSITDAKNLLANCKNYTKLFSK